MQIYQPMQFNLYALALMASTALASALGLYAYKRRAQPTALILCLMMAGMAIWSLAGAMEATVVTLSQKVFWSAASYIGVTGVPVLFLALALKYAGREGWLRRSRLAILAILPLLTLGLAFTNSLHGWHWSNVYLTDTWIGVTAIYERGFWFWIWAVAGYAAMGAGIFQLSAAALNMPRLFARQARVLALAPLLPIAANLTYIFNPGLRHGIDYTPFFFTAAGLLIALAIFRNRWLDVMPLPSHVLVRKLRDGILVFDAAERLIGMNPAAEELLALTEADYGARFADAMKALSVPRSFLQTGEDMVLDASLPGGTTTIEVRHTQVPDPRGRVMKHMITLRDITAREKGKAERERLQAQLLQAQKMESVGRLASGVAHDFNNLLTAIMGYAELSLDELDPETMPSAREYVECIRQEARRSAGLIRQLLAFARKQTVEPEVMRLADAVHSLLNMLQRLIGEHVELLHDPDPSEVMVEMDPSQLDQVLVNLLVNARDAIAGTGRVVIKTAEVVLDDRFCAGHPGCVPGRYASLSVQDTGCGMDPETRAQIFEPFFTTKEFGTGLGLATVYGIVKLNNGFIYVDSEPGAGTCFRLYFPPCTGVAAPAALPSSVRHAPHPETGSQHTASDALPTQQQSPVLTSGS